MDDILSLLNADEPTAQEKAQAMAQALRRQQFMGLVANAMGSPMQGIAKNLQQDTENQQQMLAQVPQQRLRMALEKQGIAKNQAEMDAMNHPATAQVLSGALKKFGFPVDEGTPAQVMETVLPVAEKSYAAEQMAAARKAMLGMGGHGGAAAPGLDDQTLDMLATQMLATGQIPNVGGGMAGTAARAAVAQRAAKLAAQRGDTPDLAGAHADYSSTTHSIQKLQTQADNIEAFEKTGLKNLQTMLDASQKIVNTGSPMLNKPARWLATNVAGDPNMTGFEAARQTAATEAAKILSGALGPLSDSARHEAEIMMDQNATPEQLAAAARTLVRDFGNRKQANQEQLSEMRGRIGVKRGAAPLSASPALEGGAPTRKTVGGKTYEKRTDGWYEVQ